MSREPKLLPKKVPTHVCMWEVIESFSWSGLSVVQLESKNANHRRRRIAFEVGRLLGCFQCDQMFKLKVAQIIPKVAQAV